MIVYIGTVIDILKKTFPDANTIEILTFYGGLFALLFICIRWCWKWYLLSYPFKIKETFENYDYYKSGKNRPKSYFYEPIKINCLNGKWDQDRINLHITTRRKVTLKQINVRFIEKKLFRKSKNIAEDKIFIKNVDCPQEHYLSQMNSKDDKAGGCDCYFNPDFERSKGGILFLEIYPIINFTGKIKCKISIDDSSGVEEKRTFSRKTVYLTNKIT